MRKVVGRLVSEISAPRAKGVRADVDGSRPARRSKDTSASILWTGDARTVRRDSA